MSILIFRSNGFFKSYFIVVNMSSEMENVNLRKVKRFLPPKMRVRVASLNAEQYIGYAITNINKHFNL